MLSVHFILIVFLLWYTLICWYIISLLSQGNCVCSEFSWFPFRREEPTWLCLKTLIQSLSSEEREKKEKRIGSIHKEDRHVDRTAQLNQRCYLLQHPDKPEAEIKMIHSHLQTHKPYCQMISLTEKKKSQ